MRIDTTTLGATPNYAEAVTEESRAHDDVLDESELESGSPRRFIPYADYDKRRRAEEYGPGAAYAPRAGELAQ